MYADVRGSYMARSLTTSSAASMSTARKLKADAIYRRGTCGIGTYASAVEGMITAEFDSIRMVFAREDWGRAVIPACRPVFNDFGKTLRDLNSHIQSNLMTDCFLAFEIVELVSGLALRLDAVFPDMEKPIAELLQPIRDTAKASLTRILEDTRSRVQGLVSLPPDSAAIPLSAEVVGKLQNLVDYMSPVTSVMASVGDGNWSTLSPSSPNGALGNGSMRSFDTLGAPDGPQLFAHYSSDVLETLINGLDARARLLMKSQGAGAVFMCNNISVVEGALRSSELGPLIANTVQPRIDTWRSKHVKLYVSAWTPASTALLDVQYTNRQSGRPASGAGHTDSAAVIRGLSTKEKDNVKEKFRTFNATFDDLVGKHKAYKMERDVRPMLGREVQRTVEPLYGRFWDRYHEIDKGKGKYVRYSKGEIANVFATMS
jgi:exocyst complex protein 7